LKNKTIYKGVITHMRGKQQDFRTEKYIRYGIRKFSFGAASVAIAVGLMFLGNGVVSATEVQSAETAITTSASSQGDKETEKAEPKAETVETVKPETVSPETIKPETVNPETVKPETVNPETVNSETMKPETVNPETEKATEVKSEVAATKAATKATLANTDASQADVDAQAETVSALSTAVTESNTAEKKLRPTEIYTTNGTPGTAGTAVKTNAKYANSVETVDNNKRGNRENTDSINQRRRVKRSAIDTTNFAQNYDRKVLSGSVTYPGFSVSDPDYPSGMWIDPDKSHYSYEWLQAKIKGKNHGNQIVFSTNRTGDGIVYVTELSESNKVLKQYTLKQNTKVKSAVFDNTTYYNDVYIAMVHSDGFDKFGNSFVANSFVTKYRASTFDNYYYSTLAYFVPKLITQTTYFVDKDGKQITDSNGNPVVPYTQKGLVGQKYTTSPILINGYYAIAPANSNGVMSPYGEIGASYVKDFHDGVVITYTQTGSDGTMSASIARYGIVLKKWTNLKPSDPTETYSDDRFVVGSYGIKNPYIPQTSDIKYVYNKLGNWIVSNPDGSTKSIIYPNDPSDPTKIADSSVPGYPVIDFLPGYTPKDHMGTPLVPVDPDDHTKGYIPPTPENPTEDTVITYEKDSQKATVTYVVEGTGTVLHTDNLEGKSGEPIDYSTVAKLAELKALGYDLVTDGFTTATDKNFDKDTKVDQSFVVTVKPHVEPIKPVDPENPNDPNKPKPGDPIDPNNPDGPKWTEDLIKQIDTTRHVNRTITSVNEKGEEVAQKVTDKVTFTREGKINSVTGEITYGNWTAKDGDTTFDKVESPVVQGYILKDAKQKEVAATTGLTVDSKDENIEVVYTKLGSWVPKVPEGFEEPKLDKPQYPNDPTDPTKPGTPTTVIPQVPGTTPKDSNGNPLKPVDPNDPSKGYVPPTPENPTEDTVINYVPVPQPVRPTDNGDNNGTPTTAAQPASPSTPQYMDGKRELPNTGTEDNASLAALGLLGVLSGFGLVAHKKKED
jgi:LPXTG-motif cell wall-anchored protein